jgi:predicted enzyme related to lactoylglutathione lyase
MPATSIAWQWEHSSLAVADLDRAIAFYRAAFGYEVIFEARGMADLIQRLVGLPGLRCDLAQLRSPIAEHTLELIAFHHVPPGKEDQGPTRPGAAHLAFRVQDLDRALREVQQLGAELIGEVTLFPEGRCAYCREPSGSVFELDEAPPEEPGMRIGGDLT